MNGQNLISLLRNRKIMSITTLFTPEELSRIEAAVKKAESEISGEIVPVFVKRSEDYEIGNLRAGLTFAILSAAVWLAFYEFRRSWEGHWIFMPEVLLVLMALAFCLGFFLALGIPKIRMWFMLSAEIAEAVDRRAQIAFLEENVFLTRHRTGILIFISELEHRAEVLGDVGISAKVSREEWTLVLRHILKGMRQKDKAEGICRAIEAAGQLLREKGFPREADDENELKDNLRGKA